jgi:hypothetical protein
LSSTIRTDGDMTTRASMTGAPGRARLHAFAAFSADGRDPCEQWEKRVAMNIARSNRHVNEKS